MRTCPKCLLPKPPTDFVSHRWCQECKRAARAASYLRNKTLEIRRAAEYNKLHPEMKTSSDRCNYQKNRTYRLFVAQRTAAKRRRIEFQFSYDEWLLFWGEDVHKRGTGSDDLCMARHNDSGPYVLGNVSKQTNRDNLAARVF